MTDALSGGASVPLYRQVMDDIKSGIEHGDYPPGSQIPTEMELARDYGVGRVTVRRAIEELAVQGYLSKQQGRGTFVNAPKLKRKVHQSDDVQSFSDACRANGMEPGARLVARNRLLAYGEAAKFFGLPEGADLICIERLRTADGVPVMLEHNTFPLRGFEFLETADLRDNSIFRVVCNATGRAPESSTSCTLEIERATADVADKLSVPVGEPLFYMDVRFVDGKGMPLILGHQRIVGSRYIFDI